MLRGLVLLLAIANLFYALWSRTAGPAASSDGEASQREPGRLQQQIHPELVQLVASGAVATGPASSAAGTPVAAEAPAGPPASATPAASAASPAAADGSAGVPPSTAASALPAGDDVLAGSPVCVEAGPFNDAEMGAATQALQRAGVPAGGWVDMRRDQPGIWIVYMGRYTDAPTLQRKRDELHRRGVPFQNLLDAPALEPGLSLGRYASPAEAQARLNALERAGVHTARVVALKPPGSEHRLRVDALDDPRREQLRLVAPGVLRSGWSRCDSSADVAAH